MDEHSSEATTTHLSLIERKQRAARARIVDAADQLFAERGFDGVSVTDIAERAEVGRTTFFRHFKDKTEVVFAKEQAMFDAITNATSQDPTLTQPVDSLAGALSTLEPLVIRLVEYATADVDAYQQHARLLDAHDELRSREALKHQLVALEFAKVLEKQGAPFDIAATAAQLALACYSIGRTLSSTPGDLAGATRAAFRSVLAIDSARS